MIWASYFLRCFLHSKREYSGLYDRWEGWKQPKRWDRHIIGMLHFLLKSYQVIILPSLSRVTDKRISSIQAKINGRPREKLNFSTPKEEFFRVYSYFCTCWLTLWWFYAIFATCQGGCVKMHILTRTQRCVRMVKMQGAEAEGAGSVLWSTWPSPKTIATQQIGHYDTPSLTKSVADTHSFVSGCHLRECHVLP